jgi:putative ABC transport system permease protein
MPGRISSFFRNLLRKRTVEQALDDELQSAVELLTHEKMKLGLLHAEARREAIIELGGVEQVKEDVRAIRLGRFLETLAQDVRIGSRAMAKSPGFTAVAVITLALGIGANTAIFSVVNAVLLHSLPFHQPERLVQLWETGSAVPLVPLAAPDFLDWRAQNQTFEDMVIFTQGNSINMSGAGEPERILGIFAQANFFSVLGSGPLLGRTFVEGEDRAGHNHIAVLSYGLWQRLFGGKPDALQKEIVLNGEKYQIIGVMPADFTFPSSAELWVPFWDMDPAKLPHRGSYAFHAIGRLKPGVTPQQARADLQSIAQRLSQQYPNSNRGVGANVIELREQLVGNVRPALLVLLGAVALVLLIACVNVANLLLARASTRRREIALRLALGARPGRVIRQLLTESVLLSALAALPGLFLAVWGVTLLRSLPGVPVPDPAQIHLDAPVLFFALGITLLTGALFGLAPAIHAGRQNLHDELKSGGKGAGVAASSIHWLRDALVVGEVALSLSLLIAAGLLLRSFAHLRAVEIGVRAENVLTARIALSDPQFPTPEERARIYHRIAERLAQSPGVDAAAVATEIPLDSATNTYAQRIGAPMEEQGSLMEWNEVTPGYFAAFGIPFRSGRNFSAADEQRAREVAEDRKKSTDNYSGPNMVAVVNQTMAADFWPGQDAVGKMFLLGHSLPTEVIGVVADTKIFAGLQQKTFDEAYFPVDFSGWGNAVVIAHGTPAQSLPGAVRQAVAEVDRDLPAFKVRTMEQVISGASSSARFQALLLGIFAGLALILAAIGIYGVMSYLVAQRTNEIGIRMALGAHPRDILQLVIGRGFILTVLGIAAGLVAASLLSHLLASLLYGVSATDPATFAAVAALLAIVALSACYLPARRATRVSPLVALRYE